VQITDELAERIERGALVPGDRLPPERDLADELGVSRSVVRQAVLALATRGLVRRGVGRGTFVHAPKVEHDRTGRVLGFTAQLERAGLQPGAEVLHAAGEPADPETALALELAPGDLVYRVERLRFGSGEPLTLERSCFPAGRVPRLLDADLDGSLYAILATEHDLAPERAVERLEPVLARAAEARALGVAPRSPLMLVTRTAYAADGTPVEHARDLHRGDRAAFVVEVSPRG